MATKTKTPFELKNPFSKEFMIAWEYWKKFKKEQFRFTYKPIGEQHAIDYLYEMAGGNEQTAKLIIKQSLGNCWQGLFPLKNNQNGQFNRQNQSTVNKEATRQSINDLYSQRFGNGKQATA